MLVGVGPIGREFELADIAGRIGDGRRLVTIVGPGGIGKTTVARAAHVASVGVDARRLAVDLTRVERPDAVLGSIASQLGFPSFDDLFGSPEMDAVVLVDNCEHVVDEAATAIAAMLDNCPRLVVLATSRSPLAIEGESIVALAPLELPQSDDVDSTCASVRLFIERARDAGVSIADHELAGVAELCRRLDGMPLPIELAASRTRMMRPMDLVDQLRDGLGVLERPRYRGATRHRSVRATIEWSIRLLEDGDRDAFVRLGTVPGWFDAETASALLHVRPAEAGGRLERLVDASLVMTERSDFETGFRMLEPVRAVAVDLLRERGQLLDTRERVVGFVEDYIAGALADAARVWTADLLPTLMRRFDLIALAIRHCVEHDRDPTRAHHLYRPMWGALHQGRVDEVVSLGQHVMQRWPVGDGRVETDVAAIYAMGILLTGRIDDAEKLAANARADGDHGDVGSLWLRRVLAFASRARGDHRRSADLLTDLCEVATTLKAHAYDLESRAYRAQDLAALGHVDEALSDLDDVVAESVERRSIVNELAALSIQASVLVEQVDPDLVTRARQLADDALTRSETIRYPFGISCNLQTLVVCGLRTGDLGDAARAADRLLKVFARAGVGDVRRALDLAAAVAHAAAHPSAGDLAAFARQLPESNPLIFHLDLPDPTPNTHPLDRRTAKRAAVGALAEIASASDQAVCPPIDHHGQDAGGPVDASVFMKMGDRWEVRYAGATISVTSTKGMEDLATLLRQPGRDIHCVELAGIAIETASTGDVIDSTARRQYEERIRELHADVEEAEANNDSARAERAQTELDAIVDHLSAALGLGSKPRRQAGTAERARSTVTHRLRAAIRRLAELNPTLGHHLHNSITTGTYCSYRPEQPTDWQT